MLKQEAETANKYLQIVEFTLTQKQLLKEFEEEMGTKFAVTNASTVHIEREAREMEAKGEVKGTLINTLLVFSFRDGQNHAGKEEVLANDLLGLPKSNLRQAVRDYIKTRSA